MANDPHPNTVQGTATWACYSDPDAGNLWYVKLDERKPPPYKRPFEVVATIDVDSEGCLAGIEILDGKMPGPPSPR